MIFNSIKLSPGEFFDKYTIILRKAKLHPESDYFEQLSEMNDVVQNVETITPHLIESLCHLMMINTDIWNLESDIRKGKEGLLGLEEVGRRAIEIRKLNTQRIDLVNMINTTLGWTKHKQEKFNHASE